MHEGPFFIIGIAVGVLLMFGLMMNFGAVDSNEYQQCQKVCAFNDGVQFVYLDGECICNDGAAFENPDGKQDDE